MKSEKMAELEVPGICLSTWTYWQKLSGATILEFWSLSECLQLAGQCLPGKLYIILVHSTYHLGGRLPSSIPASLWQAAIGKPILLGQREGAKIGNKDLVF